MSKSLETMHQWLTDIFNVLDRPFVQTCEFSRIQGWAPSLCSTATMNTQSPAKTLFYRKRSNSWHTCDTCAFSIFTILDILIHILYIQLIMTLFTQRRSKESMLEHSTSASAIFNSINFSSRKAVFSWNYDNFFFFFVNCFFITEWCHTNEFLLLFCWD